MSSPLLEDRGRIQSEDPYPQKVCPEPRTVPLHAPQGQLPNSGPVTTQERLSNSTCLKSSVPSLVDLLHVRISSNTSWIRSFLWSKFSMSPLWLQNQDSVFKQASKFSLVGLSLLIQHRPLHCLSQRYPFWSKRHELFVCEFQWGQELCWFHLWVSSVWHM